MLMFLQEVRLISKENPVLAFPVYCEPNAHKLKRSQLHPEIRVFCQSLCRFSVDTLVSFHCRKKCTLD